MSKRRVSKLLDRFAAAEREFLNREFLARTLRGGVVRVRIDGVILQMKIEPADFQGWGVFLPITHDSAILVREATLAERRRYLAITTKTSLILCDRKVAMWTAIAAHAVNPRFQFDSPVPIRLIDGADLFDTVNVGFDGANFWFDRIDPRADVATASWLRSMLGESVVPKKLARRNLTAQQRAAYTLHYYSRVRNPEREPEVQLDKVETELREALQHAGARFDGYVEHRDGFRVTYTVDGHRHVSSVNKDDLTVQVAGICLNGQDRQFDLTSLVGVLNESNARYAVAVGEDGMSEEEYWAVHPPGE